MYPVNFAAFMTEAETLIECAGQERRELPLQATPTLLRLVLRPGPLRLASRWSRCASLGRVNAAHFSN